MEPKTTQPRPMTMISGKPSTGFSRRIVSPIFGSPATSNGPPLPWCDTLVCADAGFYGYHFWQSIRNHGHQFLIRVGSKVRLRRSSRPPTRNT